MKSKTLCPNVPMSWCPNEREREVFIHVCDIVDNNSQLTDHIHWAFNSFCMNGMELLASLLVFAYVTYVTWYFSGFLVL